MNAPFHRHQADALVPVWTLDPRVVAILASFAGDPPTVEMIPALDRWSLESDLYTGNRVDLLQAIWQEYAAPVLAHCDAIGDYRAYEAFCFGQPDVQTAVGNALRIVDLPQITSRAAKLNPAMWGQA